MEIKFLDSLTAMGDPTNTSSPSSPYKIRFVFPKTTLTDNSNGQNVRIKSKKTEAIEGWIAEDSLEISTGNDWTELYNAVGGGSLDTLNNILVGVSGWSLRTKDMLTKIWQGTKTIDIKVGVIFQSETNAKTDVWDKMWKLYRGSVPSAGDSAATAASKIPGFANLVTGLTNFFKQGASGIAGVPLMSNIADALSSGVQNLLNAQLLEKPGVEYDLKSVQIGNMLILNNVLIRNVFISPSMSNFGFDLNKGDTSAIGAIDKIYPNYARVDVELMTNSIWTTDDITNIIDNNTPKIDKTVAKYGI